MTEFRNRKLTDYWTLVLPSGWRDSNPDAKLCAGFESDDSNQIIRINTVPCQYGSHQDPPSEIAKFQGLIQRGNKKIFGSTYTTTFAERNVSGIYHVCTIAGFDSVNHLGVCARIYAGPSLSVIIQIQDYNCNDSATFNRLWSSIFSDFSLID